MLTKWAWILLGINWGTILIVAFLLCWMWYKDGKDMEALEKEKTIGRKMGVCWFIRGREILLIKRKISK